MHATLARVIAAADGGGSVTGGGACSTAGGACSAIAARAVPVAARAVPVAARAVPVAVVAEAERRPRTQAPRRPVVRANGVVEHLHPQQDWVLKLSRHAQKPQSRRCRRRRGPHCVPASCGSCYWLQQLAPVSCPPREGRQHSRLTLVRQQKQAEQVLQ